ncbi:MAG: SRPBCC family protein [Acidobacteriota bacterium]
MSHTFERTIVLPASPKEVFDWHARPGAFDRLVPPWQTLEILERNEALIDESRLSFMIRQGPISIKWVARHEDVVDGHRFVDVQEKGPFAAWRHEHLFEPAGQGCRLRDAIRYRLPMGWLGGLVAGPKIQADLEAMFAYRHFTTWHDLTLHRNWKRHLCLGMVARPGHRLAQTTWAVLSTGGHHVEELKPGDKPPVWWDQLDAVIDFEPDGRAERLERWRGDLMISVGAAMPTTRWDRHVHIRPAPLLGARRSDYLPAGFQVAARSGPFVSLDDAAASITFALQTPSIRGDVEVQAGGADVLQRQGFRFRHPERTEAARRYAGKFRQAFSSAPAELPAGQAMPFTGGQ